MKSLFIDNTDKTTLGILDKDFKFEEYSHFEDKKSASSIHSRLHKILEQCQTTIEDIHNVYIVSGPGSYTGIRVVEGIGQIMKWQGKNIFSFYHFEIPSMVGISSGKWISQAWKSELFIYSWNGKENSAALVFSDEYTITGEEYSFGEECNSYPVQSCRNLLLNNPVDIFTFVTKRGDYRPPYYYRELEREFQPNP